MNKYIFPSKLILGLLISLFLFSNLNAQYQLEKLDRGVVAVSLGGSRVFVSWRWLGTEDEINFNLYRNGVKINATPLSTTNFTDNAGSTSSVYSVRAVVGGIEQAPSEGVNPWAQQYMRIPIQAPQGGTTPDGVTYNYNANDASIADLDGDGKWEIILKWDPSNSKDNSQAGYTGNTFIDAYKLDGRRLWRIDFGRNIRAGAHYLDFMVYDFDGDGKAEMMARTAEATVDGVGTVIGNAQADYRNTNGYVLSGPEYITVFNGTTGRAMATKNLYPPRGSVADWGDNYGNRVDRFKACVAYLDGQKPSGVFVRGYYAKWGAEAIDWRNGQLTQRWTYMCPNDRTNPCYEEGAHSVSVADVDDDGKQEVIMGSNIIDDNGTMYYNTRIGHGDALHVSDLDPSLPGLEISHIQEPVGNAGLYMYSGKTKQVLWQKPTNPGANEGPGRGVCADISATFPGAESWVAGGGISGVFDAKGNLTNLANPQSCNFLVWWDGDLSRELLNGTVIDKYGAGRMLTANNLVGLASNNGTKSNPALSGDIIGDWREEVIWRSSSNDALYLFTTTITSSYKFRTLLHDPQYRVALAWQNTGYNQPPHVGFFLGNGMDNPPKTNITLIDPFCAATISTTSPTTFCAGGSVVLSASAGSSYVWKNGNTTLPNTSQTLTATAAGTYTVEVTNVSGCKATSAVTTVTVNPLPTATISTTTPTTFCTGGSAVLTASAGSSYVWKNGNTTLTTTTQSLTSTAAGTYTVEVTNINGCKATSAVTTVTVNPLPTAAISTTTPTTFCAGGSVVLSASAGSSYVWKNGNTTLTNTTQTLTATAAGTYTVEVTNVNGCKATSAVTTVSVNPLPTATISTTTPTTFCAGGSVVLSASAGISYVWKNGNTTLTNTPQTISATAAGTYTVEVTNVNGCKATSAVTTVTVNPLPTATISTTTPTTFCAGGSVVLTASAGSLYVWKNGNTTLTNATQTLTATAAGTYTIEVTNVNGCKATSAVTTVTVNPLPTATISTTTPTTFCTGGSVVLTASAGSSYVWKNGNTTLTNTTQTLTATSAGTYTVEVTNVSGCKATSAVTTVTVNPLPTATISTTTPTTFCAGGSVVLTASAGSSYVWKNGNTTLTNTTQTLTATSAGTYIVEVTNVSGCKATSAVTTLTVNPLPTAAISTTTPTTFCAGGSVVLTASAGSLYVWKNGNTTLPNTTQTLTATAAGTYTVEITNVNGCKATSAVTTVTVNPLPTAAISTTTPTTFCAGGSVVLTASAGSLYVWKNGNTTLTNTTQTLTATAAGTYTVEITNVNGCKSSSAPTNVTVQTPTTWYADTDNDGLGDINTTKIECTRPIGYVSLAGDNCPNDINKITTGNCGCGKTENSCLDCFGTANGSAFLDECQLCVGGLTQNEACIKDCHGDFGGTAFIDSCGKCAGGNSGLKPVTQKDQCITSDNGIVFEETELTPNPFNDIIYLNAVNPKNFEVFDQYGKSVLKGFGSTIITSNLTQGIYLVLVQDKDRLIKNKLIKK